ncbi:conserved hypothetical protein [Aspergillus terreus NIH2624]|uniref:Protein kinase domain-containing protein n=1 Tax=Aspergillus terreus (strain NIH 2624 / FGSC A1156) TaxID=341663 RepID=Q0CUN0_ASPTN|nr:uncharacterized protein ATEG_02604 [Aspergillus terreus NIH2624]EAU37566.1 conserved hypothetical protein [Aspergillus terreus NIH2624]
MPAAFNFQHIPTLVQNKILNSQTMLIPIIKTPAAVDLTKEIFTVKGVDRVLVSSNDLCTDLGIPGKYDSSLYQHAVAKIFKAGKKAGKPVLTSSYLGQLFFYGPSKKPVTPLGLRPPELILTGAVDNTIDVWSFGCLFFELITGQPLFCIPGSEYENNDHLLSLTVRLGALPDELFRHWETSSLYFTPDRQLFNCQLGGVAPGEEPLMVEQTSEKWLQFLNLY